MEDWYRLAEVSESMKIPLQTLYRYHREGRGPRVHKIGKHLRVSQEDLRLWIESRLFASDDQKIGQERKDHDTRS